MQALRPASRFFMSWQGRVRKRRREQETRDTRSRPQVPSLRSPVPRLSSPVFRLPSFVSRLSSPVFRLSSFVPRHCEAPKGLWQSAIPVQTPVSRPNVGNPMGAEPPWSSGRESRGDRLEIGPRWRFLSPVSFPLKETGSRRSARSPRPVPVFRPRRSGQTPVPVTPSRPVRTPPIGSPEAYQGRSKHPLSDYGGNWAFSG